MRYDKAEIRAAFLSAHQIITSGNCTGAKVLQVMQPYHDCTEVFGLSERFQQESIGLIFALTADGYRVEKEFPIAAKWYEKASIHGSAHAGLYVRMVCAHQLSHYYKDALSVIQRQEEKCLRRTLFDRVNLTIDSWHLLFDWDWLQLRWHKSRDIKFLKSQLS